MKFHIGWKKASPMAIPAARASTALMMRFRSSRRWSMSGMRPSGFCCRCERMNRSPTMRAPAMVLESFAMTASGNRVSTGANLAGLLGAQGLRGSSGLDGRGLGVHGGRPLQVAYLLLERLDLPLLVRLLRGGDLGRSGDTGGGAF